MKILMCYVVVTGMLVGCAGKAARTAETAKVPPMPTEILRAVNGVCTCAGQTWKCPSLAVPSGEVTRWDEDAWTRNKMALGWGNAPESVEDKCLVTRESWVWTKPL